MRSSSTRSRTILAILFAASAAAIPAQSGDFMDTLVQTFQDGTLNIKYEVIENSLALPAEDAAPLYLHALTFIVSNPSLLGDYAEIREIAIRVLDRIKEAEYTEAKVRVLELFRSTDDNVIRIKALDVMGVVGAGDERTINYLNTWVRDQVNLALGGGRPDLQELGQAITSLGVLGDQSSFAPLTQALFAQLSDHVSDRAIAALRRVEGNLVDLVSSIVRQQSIQEREDTFNYFVVEGIAEGQTHLELTAFFLRNALMTQTRDFDEHQILRRIRTTSTQILTEAGFSAADRILVQNFNETVQEWERGEILKSVLLGSIASLGAMDSDIVAERLTRYLELLNAYTEQDRPYDTQIVIAVIENLELLGNAVAYSPLFYATLLDYPQRVKEKARSAIAALAN